MGPSEDPMSSPQRASQAAHAAGLARAVQGIWFLWGTPDSAGRAGPSLITLLVIAQPGECGWQVRPHCPTAPHPGEAKLGKALFPRECSTCGPWER